MNERMRALEKLANSPNTPPNEAANARRILERLKTSRMNEDAYFLAPGEGLLVVSRSRIPELKRLYPQGRELTKAQAQAYLDQQLGKKKPATPRKKITSKVRDGTRKPPPKTETEKQLGFIDKVLRRSNTIRVAVATDDKVVGTWTAKGEAQIRAVLKKALAQAHLLAQRGYETCIAVVYPDGSKTVQCWPE